MVVVRGKIPKGALCPRCGSKKICKSSADFFCLTCSFIAVDKADEIRF